MIERAVTHQENVNTKVSTESLLESNTERREDEGEASKSETGS
jgi:hypothetical protein